MLLLYVVKHFQRSLAERLREKGFAKRRLTKAPSNKSGGLMASGTTQRTLVHISQRGTKNGIHGGGGIPWHALPKSHKPTTV